jgi:hypothetical protein
MTAIYNGLKTGLEKKLAMVSGASLQDRTQYICSAF